MSDELDRLTRRLAEAWGMSPEQFRRKLMRDANANHMRPLTIARKLVAGISNMKPWQTAQKAFAQGRVPAGHERDQIVRHAKAMKRVVTKGETLAEAYGHIRADEADHDRRDMEARLAAKRQQEAK